MKEYLSIPELFQSSVEKYPANTALGWKEKGEWKKITYAALSKRIDSFSKGLWSLGIRPGDKIALMLGNSPEWVISDMALLRLDAVDVPVFATLSEEQTVHILNDSGSRGVIVSGKEQIQKLKNIAPSLPKLEKALIVGESVSNFENVETAEFEAIEKMGEKAKPGDTRNAEGLIASDTLASIIYTSGTTGAAKGAELTHGNFSSNVNGILKALDVFPTDRHLSFLPLSHAFERTAGYYSVLASGASIFYVESLETIADNIKEVNPTLIISVPRLFEKMIGRIREKAAEAPAPRRALFHWAMKVGEEASAAAKSGNGSLILSIKHFFAKLLVFKKIHLAFGGKIRFFVSGGAPLGRDVGIFFQAVGIKVLEGYGLTETSPVISFNPLEKIRLGTVGKPLGNLEIKINQEGELLVKGPSVFKKYHNNEEATKEAIDPEGWFHTGDIAELTKEGYLKITDRKKEILVLSSGKKVPPQTIEGKLLEDECIAQAVAIGNNRNFVSALIVPDFKSLKRFAKGISIEGISREELAESPQIKKLIEERVASAMAGFARYEQVKKIALLPIELSEKGGELTPTLKIKRKVVEKKYASIIENIYADIGED